VEKNVKKWTFFVENLEEYWKFAFRIFWPFLAKMAIFGDFGKRSFLAKKAKKQ
jgi:hypothetical protein